MIFVDTAFLYALVDERDQNHQRVIEVLDEYRNQDLEAFGLTTNHVVDETITLMMEQPRPGRRKGNAIAPSSNCSMEPACGSASAPSSS